jgi:hypothetical protein
MDVLLRHLADKCGISPTIMLLYLPPAWWSPTQSNERDQLTLRIQSTHSSCHHIRALLNWRCKFLTPLGWTRSHANDLFHKTLASPKNPIGATSSNHSILVPGGTRYEYFILSRYRYTIAAFWMKWLKLLCDFLSQSGSKFTHDEYHIPDLQRHGDQHIMDTVLNTQMFTNQQIRRINYCRLYLQVITLSNICDATRERFDFKIYYGRITERSSHTMWHSFNQECPSKTSWIQWRWACNLFTGKFGTLLEPMGAWLHPVSQLWRRWPYIYSPSTQQNFKWDHHRKKYLTDGLVPYNSDDCPIDSHSCDHLKPGKGMVIPSAPLIPETFSEY